MYSFLFISSLCLGLGKFAINCGFTLYALSVLFRLPDSHIIFISFHYIPKDCFSSNLNMKALLVISYLAIVSARPEAGYSYNRPGGSGGGFGGGSGGGFGGGSGGGFGGGSGGFGGGGGGGGFSTGKKKIKLIMH